MSDRKFEWPYITRLSAEDRENYKSNLPADMGTYELDHQATSELWSPYDKNSTQGVPERFLSEDEYTEGFEKMKRGRFWGWVFMGLCGKVCWDTGHWYSFNRVKNYEYFRNESMLKYVKLRASPAILVGWVLHRLVTG